LLPDEKVKNNFLKRGQNCFVRVNVEQLRAWFMVMSYSRSRQNKQGTIAVNASPLIFLAKAGLLHILTEMFDGVCTTEKVMEEIKAPFRIGRDVPELQVIRRANIRVVRLTEEEKRRALTLKRRLRIHDGEAEVAALYERGFTLILLADKDAERRLRRAGFRVINLADLVLAAWERGLVDLKEAFMRLYRVGYRTRRVRRFIEV